MSTMPTCIGTFSPGGGTFPYSVTRSAVWTASDTRLAAGVRSDAALYHPFKHRHASFVSPPARCTSIFSAAVAARCRRSPDSPALICLPMRRDACCDNFPCCRSAALLSISAHVGARIQELRGCVRGGGTTTSSRSSSNLEHSSV